MTVSNPSPGGGVSNSSTFAVDNPAPTATSLNPAFATAGGAAFSLTVTGTNFVSSSTVEWNGISQTTAFVSGTELQAQISAADIASAGSASVTVSTPAPDGGTSNALSFAINAGGNQIVAQLANDLVWDPKNQVIYLSVPSVAGPASGNTVSVLNPLTGTIIKSQFAGSEPDVLAISDDSQFLYVGLDGSASVQRFTLPGLNSDINYSLGKDSFFGPYFALDLQVPPAAPHTTAVTRANFNVSPAAQGGVQIFDDATMRPTTVPGFSGTGHLFDSLQWGSDATALYAANNEDTGFDFYTLTVNSSGAVFGNDYGGVFSSFGVRIHYDQGTKLVYSDDGHIVTPSTGLPAGLFAASGVMVPDSSLNKAFFLGQTQSQVGSTNFTIESFDLVHFTPLNSIVVSNVTGNPLRLIRWGANGLAFNTTGGQIILFSSGTFVSSAAVRPAQVSPLIDHVQRTWKSPKTFSLPATEPKTSN
ncbi:MAG TPA: hypothetical protein VKT53_12965 [Candidatus Acidoferrum sp.]|nr:hypothetical protein [Candidatus Acidoferrum sp.]